MTDTATDGSVKPFVHLFLRTEEDGFKEPHLFPLTGNFLLSFEDQSAFSMEGIAGGSGSSTARSKCRLVLVDPTFTYLESLLLINKTLDYEFGWVAEDGTILSTSGRIRAMVGSIEPKFQFQGTEIEVILYADASATAQQGTPESLIAASVITQAFIPEDVYFAVKEGRYYNAKFPHKLFTDPKDEQLVREAKAKREKEKEALRASSGGGFSMLNQSQVEARLKLADADKDAPTDSSIFGEKYELPEGSVPYRSVGEIVERLARSVGMKFDIDETQPAKDEIRVVGKTIQEFIKTQLVPIAVSKEGNRSGYKFWIRGNTFFFKLPNPKKVVKTIGYAADNRSFTGRLGGAESIALNFTLKIQPNLTIHGARANMVAASFDPIEKKFRGINLTSENPSGGGSGSQSLEAEIGQALQASDAEFDWAYPAEKEQDRLGTPIFDSTMVNNQQESLAWSEAEKITGEVAKNMTALGGQPLSQTETDKIKNRAYRVIRKRQREEQEAFSGKVMNQISAQEPETKAAVSKTFEDTAAALNATKIPSRVGRLYVLPYPDSRTSAVGRSIFSDATSRPMFQASATILGDPNVGILQHVNVELHTPNGLHYGSGRYMIQGVSNRIDGSGFTTELTLSTDGVSGKDSLSANGIPVTKPNANFQAASTKQEPKDSVDITPEVLGR